ncbi:MAG TPA: hypothetical protein PK668_25970 [Myxococcota bacterium]|nr:hypothetical protein [Myxococcota bacterium]HRY96974.1 hypothetical protein [Myxococcota bacterium]
MKSTLRTTLAALLALALLSPAALAGGPAKSKTPPKPLNAGVKYEPYPDTDVALLTYQTSRTEFRVGHAPWRVNRFHVAEFVLVSEHITKYLRPDFKAEIQMSPNRDQPALMASKTFQERWTGLLKAQEKLTAQVKALKVPAECQEAHKIFEEAFEDGLLLARTVAKRCFASQDTRSRELVRADLKGRFEARNKEWFGRLNDDFEETGDLSKLYPRFFDLLVQPQFDKAAEKTQQCMGKVGLELATPVEEKGTFGEDGEEGGDTE